MHTVPTKRSYHPHVLVAYHLNCLDMLSAAPRTTRFDWDHKDIQNSFGYEWSKENNAMFNTLQLVAQNKRVLAINKALLQVIAIKRFVEAHGVKLVPRADALKKVVLGTLRKVSCTMGVGPALRCLNFSPHYYSSLKSKTACASSSLVICRVKHPAQLLPREVVSIKKYCMELAYQYWPLSSVYHQILNDQACHMNLSTFYKYASLLGLKRSKVMGRRKNHEVGIRASAPFEILHADLTEFKTGDNQKSYIYLVQDNFSRAILSYKVSQERRASYTLEKLAKVKAAYLGHQKMSGCALLTGDGPENKGGIKEWVNESGQPKINHLIAQGDVPYSNSMIGAANKQLKYGFLYHQNISDSSQLGQYIQKAVEDFNNRPHHVLKGLSPQEVLKGKRHDNNNSHKLLLQARQTNVKENQTMKCCNALVTEQF